MRWCVPRDDRQGLPSSSGLPALGGARESRSAIFLVIPFGAKFSISWFPIAAGNPLVNPTGAFELELLGTSFRELAERLSGYARENGSTGEKLRLYVCGPLHTLTPFLDADKFEIVRKDAAPQFTVALNRCLQSTGPNHETQMAFLDKPWMISIGRGNLIFAAVARNDSGPP